MTRLRHRKTIAWRWSRGRRAGLILGDFRDARDYWGWLAADLARELTPPPPPRRRPGPPRIASLAVLAVGQLRLNLALAEKFAAELRIHEDELIREMFPSVPPVTMRDLGRAINFTNNWPMEALHG